jgi:pyruvate dehydrogenase E2 component (dihydrolipoamide acetyltransferase)
MPGTVEPAEISVLGRSVHFIAGGAGAETFVFVHGFGADHTTWMQTLPAFFNHGRVFALDLPGHGRSSADVGDGSITTLAALLDAFLDSVNVTRAHLVGHSLGGAVATELALTHASKVGSLTLVAPIGFDRTINRDFVTGFPELADAGAARALAALLVANPRLISDRMIADMLTYLARPGVRQALRRIAAAAFPGGEQSADYRRRIAALAAPVRVVWGADDRILAIPREIDASLPIAAVAGAGHLVHLEASAKVNRLLLPPA